MSSVVSKSITLENYKKPNAMYYHHFERNARRIRNKALFFTIAFHVALIGGIVMSGTQDWQDYVPAVVQEWLGMEDQEAVAVQLPDEQQEAPIRP